MKKEFTYSADNDLEATTYTVNGKVLKYTYETDHTPDKRDAKVGLPCGLEQVLAYDGLGRTKEIALGENLVKDIYYAKYGDHATNRVSSVWHGINGIRKENTRYTYDKAGNVETVIENGKLVARYAYDELNRLVREDNVRFGTFTYQYDAAGNILSKTEYAFTLKDTPQDIISVKEYSYKQHGWKDQLRSFNGEQFVYDVMGNPTTYRDRTLTWQGRRLLTFAKEGRSATYTYDFNGVRTSKTLKGINKNHLTVNYIYDGNNLIAEQRGTELITYFYGADGVAGFEYKDKTYLYRKNVQGDITHIYQKLTNGELKIVSQYVYDAWGNHDVLDAEGKVVDRTANVIANINPFRYRGYYFDAETGLYYLQTRYYDPELGRFISADSIEYLDPETLGGLNLYAYCDNNPIMNADPMGTSFLVALIVGAIIAGVVAGSVKAVGTAISGGSAKECLGSFVGGFITGAVLGAATILGGGFAVGAITATAATVLGTAAFLTAGTFLAGMGAYAAENAISGKPIYADEALKNGAITFAQGVFSFGVGAMMGAAGFFNNLKPGNGYMDALKYTSALFKTTVGKGGIKTLFYGTMAYLGENLGPMVLRTFIKNIFTTPWNLIKP